MWLTYVLEESRKCHLVVTTMCKLARLIAAKIVGGIPHSIPLALLWHGMQVCVWDSAALILQML